MLILHAVHKEVFGRELWDVVPSIVSIALPGLSTPHNGAQILRIGDVVQVKGYNTKSPIGQGKEEVTAVKICLLIIVILVTSEQVLSLGWI